MLLWHSTIARVPDLIAAVERREGSLRVAEEAFR